MADALAFTPDQSAKLMAQLSISRDDKTHTIWPLRSLNFAATPFPTWLSRPTPDSVVDGGAFSEKVLDDAIGEVERDANHIPYSQRIIVLGMPAIPPDSRSRLATS